MTSHMAREIAEIPAACARLLSGPADEAIRAAAAEWRALDPPLLVTVGRGSSDHAATYLSYACGIVSGVIPASYPLSLASLHRQEPRAAGAAALAISQSGSSPDIVAAATAMRDGGASLLVLTNTAGSPLARTSEQVIDIGARPERAVAATKSYVASVVAGLRVIGMWHEATELLDATERLPDALADALTRRTDGIAEVLGTTDRLIVVGRGPSLGVAQELALKSMELCQTTALAFSSAEIRHGPMQALHGDYPVLDLERGDPLPGTRTLHPPERPSLHPLVDPLLDLAPIYVALEAAARARGLDPDAPSRLTKETATT
ncbi:SIS domain-containing protein [Pontivivens ytuae]|uniref:SIS domain-containing protein n=1 Tax=Pontivivens ytuae TaxID=2789856 RepID=A0A7S9QBN4_9RHOB|nr:SIS domain-containing protein [Pontivivens ytuae]QPH52925.1 SIS domain-containing protein [Pontivivens ytuae]